jgi:probable biosynthetic protein (TIGR04098 family)
VIDTVELTPAVVGLGNLHEAALLALLADTHYRILTRGKSTTPRQIVNKAGEPLYPSVVAVEAQFPVQRPLASHELWHRFDLGVDVRTFGRQFLEVTGVIGSVGEVPDDSAAWADLALPRVTWASAWTVSRGSRDHELAMASADFLADVPRLANVPAGLGAARDAGTRGTLWSDARSPGVPVRYPVLAGRDAAIGRQMMFSHFVVVMDAAERAFLSEQVDPHVPGEMIDRLATTRRRIFYYGNCGAGDVVEIHVAAKVERSDAALVVHTAMELVDERTHQLLALAETHKQTLAEVRR